MKDAVRHINEQYRLELSEAEIERIARQAEDASRLFERLFIDAVEGVMPLPIVALKQVKA